MPMPPTRPFKLWTFRGLRASGNGGADEEERGALQQGQPAPTGNPFASVAAVLAAPGSWSVGVWAAVAVLAVVVIGGTSVGIAAGVGAFDPEESSSTSTPTSVENMAVNVVGMNAPPPSSSPLRGAVAIGAEVTAANCNDARSRLKCPTTDGGEVDLTEYGVEWAFVYGEGYVGMSDECHIISTGFLSPYSIVQAGGVMIEHYDEMTEATRAVNTHHINTVAEYNDITDLIHNDGVGATCSAADGGYFGGGDDYTCGMQYLQAGGIFMGTECAAIKANAALPFLVSNQDTGERWSHPYWTADSAPNLGAEYHDTGFECLHWFGRVPVYDIFKRHAESGDRDALIRISVPVDLPDVGPSVFPTGLFAANAFSKDRFQFLMTEGGATETLATGQGQQCTLELSVELGSPACGAGKAETATIVPAPGLPAASEIAKYTLGNYGFVYSESAELWHRAGATGCELGCCDECFQWHCPRDGSFECTSIGGYTCAATDKYTTSNEQNCGEESLDPNSDGGATVTRHRC